MKPLPCVLLGIAIALGARSQVTPRHLLEPFAAQLPATLAGPASWHPFPQSAAAWEQTIPDSTRQRLITAGEKALHFEFRGIPATLALEYSRTGNRVHYEKASFEKRNALWDLTLAESVEGKGRFIDHILDGCWSICEESYWGLPPHLGLQKAGIGLPDVQDPTVDLFTAETAAVLAWTDYFAGEELAKISPLIRPRITAEVSRRVLVPMTTANYGYLGQGRTDVKLNNWAPWVMSNYCTAALLLEKDATRRLAAVRLAMHYTDLYIDGLGDDGGCEEGPSYWSAAGACVFDLLNILGDATHGKLDIYHEPFIQKMGAYIYKTHIAGKYYINIADAPAQLIPDATMVFRYGLAVGDTVMEGFGSWITHTYHAETGAVERFRRTRTLFDLLAESTCSAYPPAEPAIKNAWFADLQLMVARNEKGLFLAAHAGTNGESHNHDDVGDIIIYDGGQPAIIDVGSGTYTARTFSSHRYDLWFNTSAYHNLPTINGHRQTEGLAAAATDVQYHVDKTAATLTMDIAKAWPATAGIRHWIRTARLDNKGVTLVDQYALAVPPDTLTQSFMTICPVTEDHPGVLLFETQPGHRLRLDFDPAAFTATIEKVEFGIPEEVAVREHWSDKPVYRVLLRAKKLPATGTLRWIFRPAPDRS